MASQFAASISSLDTTALIKKVRELHVPDGSKFDTKSLLALIAGIVNHDMPGVDDLTDEAGKHRRILGNLPNLLHKITCELNCKCSGGDDHASALELLKLLEKYDWDAKIAIILASFVVEYGRNRLVSNLYKSHPLAKMVGMLQMPEDEDEDEDEDEISNLNNIISLVRVSIVTTRFIAKFCCLPKKHIKDYEPMIAAWNQIPIHVYLLTRAVVACASQYSGILGRSESTASSTKTVSITSFEEAMIEVWTTLETHIHDCTQYIAKKKEEKYIEKLKGLFSQTVGNQKILLQTITKKKGSSLLSCGRQGEREIDEAGEGKTVLLLISDLAISHEQITKISHFYEESRSKTAFKYEIVWLPIVEKVEETQKYQMMRFEELKREMPWYVLKHPSLMKPGFVKYARDEWGYSKKSIMVSIDQRGKVAHKNAFHMMLTWGNTVYPFTHKRESLLWSSKQWSFELLVQGINQQISTWVRMREDKLICLFGGDDYDLIKEFIIAARKFGSEANKTVEMVYIYKKNTSDEDPITKINEIVLDSSLQVLDKTTSNYFWQRIESMMSSKLHQGKKITTKDEAGDPILTEVASLLTLGAHEKGWGLISSGAGAGPMKIAKAKGDLMVTAFGEFNSWSSKVVEVGFATALHEHLLQLHEKGAKHKCVKFDFPGIEDIHDIMVCTECGRVMEKHVFYSCSS